MTNESYEKIKALIQDGIAFREKPKFSENCKMFKSYLESGIVTRERILFPGDPILEISQSIQDQEVTRKEQTLLKKVLDQFTLTFMEEV